MSCSHPRKGWQVGLTLSGKKDLIITSYDVHHLEKYVRKGFESFVRCKTPIINRSADEVITEFIDIPCGKCLDCRLSHSRMWQDRILLEMSKYIDNCFVTLTYDDEHLPKSKVLITDDITGEVSFERSGDYFSLNKRDLQLFIKRLRKNTGKKIRYFACGEYGSESKRPHYHLILFGYKPDDLVKYSVNELGDVLYNSDEVSKAWQYQGYVIVGEATAESAGYVARYTTKKLSDDSTDFYEKFGIDSEFIVMSRKPGIARDYYELHKDLDLFQYEHIIIPTSKGGRKSKPPRYFEKLYEQDYPGDLHYLKEKNKEFFEDSKKLKLSNTDKSYEDILKDEEFNLSKRTKILKERSKN